MNKGDRISTYLFDWGDTLMIDFPSATGKMVNWEHVEAVGGALETLTELSSTSKIYVATGAKDSSPEEIAAAFARVGLDEYIDGYFCQRNVGFAKGSPEFLPTITARLGLPLDEIAMVGDSWEKDVEPALAIGLKVYWLNPSANNSVSRNNTSSDAVERIAKLEAPLS